jgi:hypothetical protein
VAVRGVGVEGDVSEEGEAGCGGADDLDGPEDEAIGVEGLGAGGILEGGGGDGEQGDAADSQPGELDGLGGEVVEAQAEDAGHGSDGFRRSVPLAHEQRGDEVGRVEADFLDEVADGLGLAEATGTAREGHGRWRGWISSG